MAGLGGLILAERAVQLAQAKPAAILSSSVIAACMALSYVGFRRVLYSATWRSKWPVLILFLLMIPLIAELGSYYFNGDLRLLSSVLMVLAGLSWAYQPPVRATTEST